VNRQRLLKILRYAAYPAFYLFCLALFGYLSFPYDQLKDRIISEFDKEQQKSRRRRAGGVMKLEIGELDSHWFTGVELTGVTLTMPPKRASRSRGMMAMGSKDDEEPPKPSVITINRATARVHVLPLLVGDVMLSFEIEAFGGEIEGSAPIGGEGEVDVELEGLQLAEIGPLKDMVEGLPILGVVGGTVQLTPKEGKFGKADGKLALHIDDVVIGDGKTAVQGVALPGAQVGQIVIEGTATDGTLTFDELSAHGRDFELIGDGKIKLHESWERAQADFSLKFKFADAYRDKSEATKSLLGDSEGKIKPAVELLPTSPFRRAKTDDGFYRFHFSGPLSNLEPRPAGKSSPTTSKRPSASGTNPRFKLPGGGMGRRPAIPSKRPGEVDKRPALPPPIPEEEPRRATPRPEPPPEPQQPEPDEAPQQTDGEDEGGDESGEE
jgi:type II secretion system protein N